MNIPTAHPIEYSEEEQMWTCPICGRMISTKEDHIEIIERGDQSATHMGMYGGFPGGLAGIGRLEADTKK